MSVGLSEHQVGVGTCSVDPIMNLITQDVLYGLALGLGLGFLEFLCMCCLSGAGAVGVLCHRMNGVCSVAHCSACALSSDVPFTLPVLVTLCRFTYVWSPR